MHAALSKFVFFIALAGSLAVLGAISPQVEKPRLIRNAKKLSARFIRKNQALSIRTLAGRSIKNKRLKLIAEVLSPKFGDITLEAANVSRYHDTALISYNLAGRQDLGAVDFVEISDLKKPNLFMELVYTRANINAATSEDGHEIWVTGNIASRETTGQGAFLQRLQINGNVGEIKDVILPSFAGTDLALDAHHVYATSGDRGALSVFDRHTLKLKSETSLNDARAVSVGAPRVRVLAGQPGTLHTLTKSGKLEKSFELGGASLSQSKSTLLTGEAVSLVSLGDAGTALVCNKDGRKMLTLPPVQVDSLSAHDTVTNAATSCGGLLFTGNGGAGIYVYDLQGDKLESRHDCGTVSATLLGSLEVAPGASVNHVFCQDNTLFVATGVGGMKIVEVRSDPQL